MKIVIINLHPQDQLGGSELQCDMIANRLTQIGHQVDYLAVSGKQHLYETSYKVTSIDIRNPIRLYKILKTIKPDIVYWRHSKDSLLNSSIVAKLAGCKFVYSMSSLNDSKFWNFNGFIYFTKPGWYKRNWLYYLLHDYFYINIVHSAFNYLAIPFIVDGVIGMNSDYLENVLNKRKIHIHDSVTTETKDFYWPKPYVVWVANLKNIKNPEKFFDLAEELKEIPVDFLMVGKIQNKYYNYFLNDDESVPNFHYLGEKSPIEVNGIIKNSLLLAHTCDIEGFPNNFIQAWHQGKPTISLYFDPEGIIERERIGFFSKTFPMFVQQTKFLLENEIERTLMGQRAQSIARKYFDTNENIRKLEDFLSKIVKNG